MADPSKQHLLKLLRDAEQRAEDEQQSRRQAEQRAGQAKERNQPTTFSEYQRRLAPALAPLPYLTSSFPSLAFCNASPI